MNKSNQSPNIPDPVKSAHPNIITLDRPFVLTTRKNLVVGMPYLYSEGSHHVAIRLIEAWQDDCFIYLRVEELQSPRSFTVSWNLEYTGDYYLWTIVDLPTVYNQFF